MKRILVGLALAAFSALVFAGPIATITPPGAIPVLSYSVSANNDAHYTLTVTNTGDASLTVSAVNFIVAQPGLQLLGGGCQAGDVLAAGGACTVTIALISDVTGPKKGVLTISTNGGNVGSYPVRGIVSP